MNIFVLNAGSSSLKYQLFRWPDQQPVCSGVIERIGSAQASLTYRTFDALGTATEGQQPVAAPDHEAALRVIVHQLTAGPNAAVPDRDAIGVVGHRVVHGGDKFTGPVLITAAVEAEIRRLFALAPLHNPASYRDIEAAERLFPRARQVAVFDTAFHHTLPEYAFRYALPTALYTEQRIRKFGFHGTSHQYVAAQAVAHLGQADARLITIHLGNGCSMAAVRRGRSLDTSMGFSPLAGLVMGTRSGDLDPSVLLHLLGPLGYTTAQVNTLLNQQSGMLGLTGFHDMRDIAQALHAGDARAELAYDIYAYRIRQYIGAYAAVLNGLDALVFTGGVGENDALVRARACRDMSFFGMELDEARNQGPAPGLRDISAAGSRVRILVIPTNEELEIARQCAGLL